MAELALIMSVSVLLTDMTTPPPVSAEQAEQAAQRIYDRHVAGGDLYLERIGSGPQEIIDYLRRYGPSWPALLADDLREDVPILQVRLWWLHQDQERWMFDRVEALGVDKRPFSAVFGLRSRIQGFRDRRDRLRRLLAAGGGGRPDEQQERADRAAARVAAALEAADAAWLASNMTAIREIAQACLELAPFADKEAAEWLLEVREDLTRTRMTPDAFAVVSEAVRALDGCPGIAAVTAWPRVRDRWRRLVLARRAVGAP